MRDNKKKKIIEKYVTLIEKVAKNTNKYHQEYDKDVFTYLESLAEHELDTLDIFLEQANKMADKHM